MLGHSKLGGEWISKLPSGNPLKERIIQDLTDFSANTTPSNQQVATRTTTTTATATTTAGTTLGKVTVSLKKNSTLPQALTNPSSFRNARKSHVAIA